MNPIPTRHLRLLLVVVTMLAACGSAGESTSVSAEAAPVTSETAVPTVDERDETAEPATPDPTPLPTATPAPTPTTIPTPAPTPTVVILPAGTTAVETIYLEPGGEHGWPIEAGDWVSHSFSPPLFFTLPESGTVIGDGAGRLEIALADPTNPRGHLILSTPIAISSPAGPIPIDLADEENALTSTEVLFTESVDHDADPGGAGITVRDLVIAPNPRLTPFTLPCYRSGDSLCIDPLVTTSGVVFLEVDKPHRFTTQDYGEDDRLYVVATPGGDEETLDEVGGLATAVATTALAAPDSTHSGTTFLQAIGDRSETIPAGSYVTRIGSTTLDLTISSAVENVSLVSGSPDVLGIESANDIGWLWFTNFSSFVEPGTQGEPERPHPRGSGVLTTDEFETELRARLQVIDTGIEMIGGVEAVWFDVTTDPESPDAISCAGWRDRNEFCVTWATTPRFSWYQASGVIDRYFYIEEADLFINASPWPGYTIDDVLEAYAPILEGLEIQLD